jgi:glycosyltransferase involved in cell wall biosynthesis
MTAKGITRKVLVKMEKITAQAATHVWPNSFSLLKYIKQNKLAPEKKLEVIGLGSSNGINLARFSAGALDESKLKKVKDLIHYDKGLIYFLSVGRIVQDKGIDELLKAVIAVYEKNKQVRLILVGAFEDDLDPISGEARRMLKTHPAIIQAGWSDAVEYYMQFSFALIHPSHREGFPNVLLQAGAMLCPIICSRIEGNIDIIEHGKTGLLFEVKNESQLRERLEQALADEAVLKEYARVLRVKIEQHFDQPIVHRHLYNRYRGLSGTKT